MEGAGAEVAETVAARMAELANAVFPMSPMERQPTKLAMLGDRGVSLRGAEVGMSTSQHSTSDVALLGCGIIDVRGPCRPDAWLREPLQPYKPLVCNAQLCVAVGFVTPFECSDP